LHAQEITGTHDRDDISRKRFFIYVFIDYFYSQLSLRPGDLPFLSYDSFRVRFLPILSLYRRLQLFMGLLYHPQQPQGQSNVRRHSRLGMRLLPFDWGQIAFNGSSLLI
jgi:hypothetical protein